MVKISKLNKLLTKIRHRVFIFISLVGSEVKKKKKERSS